MNWAASFLEQQPLLIDGLEPVLSSANLVLQTILGPPFSWPWNRSTFSYTTNQQDYQMSLADFGFLEGGSVVPQSGGNTFELMVKNLLQSETQQARSSHLSPLIDDGQGNITFRLAPAPDDTYTVNALYQRKAARITGPGVTWAPVPDDKNYLCQWGFLSLMSLIGFDARFGEYNTKFITSILSAQGGLSELERNIFLGNWLRVMSQVQGTQLSTSERFRAREV